MDVVKYCSCGIISQYSYSIFRGITAPFSTCGAPAPSSLIDLIDFCLASLLFFLAFALIFYAPDFISSWVFTYYILSVSIHTISPVHVCPPLAFNIPFHLCYLPPRESELEEFLPLASSFLSAPLVLSKENIG